MLPIYWVTSTIHKNRTIPCAVIGRKSKSYRIKKFTLNSELIKNLTDTQIKALQMVFKESKIFSKIHERKILSKLESYGLTQYDLQNVITYIQEKVPIIIHTFLRNLKKVCNDNKYRNAFETGITNGSTAFIDRKDWENNLFQKIYANSPSNERVKYSALNITNDPRGDRVCHVYGDCYLILKEHVKERASFIFGDSSWRSVFCISTFKYPLAMLNEMPIQFLYHLTKLASDNLDKNKIHQHASAKYIATSKERELSLPIKYESMDFKYIESHIHGDILLERDVQCVVINDKYKNNEEVQTILTKFVENHNVSLKYFSDFIDIC